MAHNWIKAAKIHKGKLHRALGVPEDKPIPASKMEEAKKSGGSLARMANLAETLKGFKKK